MLLLMVVFVGVALAFYPDWRLLAVINVVLFICATSVGIATGGSWLASGGTALLYLFTISIAFVAASLALDHLLDRQAERGGSMSDRETHLAWTGKADGSARPPEPPSL